MTRFETAAKLQAELSPAERAEMYQLFDRYFAGVEPEIFERDLRQKDWVLLIRHEERLVGFTTLQVASTVFEGQKIHVLYSGDTLTDPEVWGSPVLARAWIALVRRIQGETVGEPWYWLLLSSGFRTYRLLTVFFREHWPRHEAPTPPEASRLLAHLARERYGDFFDEAVGLVRFPQPQRLREGLAQVPAGKLHDPHVAFFLERNPGHAAGDELVCLAEVGDNNLTPQGWRMRRNKA